MVIFKNEYKLIPQFKNEARGLEGWYSQGVLYSNFTKRDKAIHIEYGDEGDVFGEAIEN